MPLPLIQVDAFARAPFEGNPAAVCFLDAARDADWMQRVAVEMNLSETAFLVRRDDGSYDLRWFTPGSEVDLCGHATLGAAHALWDSGRLPPDEEARFHTRSGLLRAWHDGETIEMDFPAEPVREIEPPAGFVEAIGGAPVFVGQNRMDFLAELESEAAVRGLEPDFRRIATLGMRGVMVTAAAADPASGHDYVARYFAPQYGIDEDPVTGSAHCAMGPYWAAKLGKEVVSGYQASRRGGLVRVKIGGDRVTLGGGAVTVLRGELEA